MPEEELKPLGSRTTTRKLIEPSNLGSSRLTETELITREPAWTDLGPPHMYYNCVTWSSYGTHNSGKKGCL